jgi:hypothetical protein
MFISELQYAINGQCLSQASVELTNNMGRGSLQITHVACEGQSTLQSVYIKIQFNKQSRKYKHSQRKTSTEKLLRQVRG